MGGQFEPKLVVNLHRNWVVNLTVFSKITATNEKRSEILKDYSLQIIIRKK